MTRTVENSSNQQARKRGVPDQQMPKGYEQVTHNSDDNEDPHNQHLTHAERHEILKKDYKNIALLMFLYLLQGLPLGLTSSLPYILSSRKVSYADQGTFSFAYWPFSLKLLWAPFVDAVFIKRFGRRKSWLIPVQYMIGLFMIIFSDYVDNLLEGNRNDVTHSKNAIYILTLIFFMFTFFAATQDIVVDGWALTMLAKENVAWASTCNSVGQTAGWFIGNVIFLSLESHDFSNKYFRPLFGLQSQEKGVVTLDSFMHFLGWIFIISTTLVMIFKKETEDHSHDHDHEPVHNDPKHHSQKIDNIEERLSVVGTYKLMWKMLWIAPVRRLATFLLIYKIGFATESMMLIKLIETGVPRENLGLLAVPLTPLQIILPLVISKYTNGPNPLTLLIKAIPGRLIMGVVCCIWVYVTPFFKDENNEYPFYYYILCLLINAIHSIFAYTIFVAQVSFYAKVSDKKIGGTYMTFLNTVANFGGNWPTTSAFYLASFLTLKYCFLDPNTFKSSHNHNSNLTLLLNQVENNFCKTDDESKNCISLGGKCIVQLDAYYLETIICIILGFFILMWQKGHVVRLERLPKSAWKLPMNFVKSILKP